MTPVMEPNIANGLRLSSAALCSRSITWMS